MRDYYRGNGSGYGLLGGLGQGVQDIGRMMMMNSMESARENKRMNMEKLKAENAERWKQKTFDQNMEIAKMESASADEQLAYDRSQDKAKIDSSVSEGLLNRNATASESALKREAAEKKEKLDRAHDITLEGMKSTTQKPEYKPGQALEKVASIDSAIGKLRAGERMTDDLYSQMVELDPAIAALLNNNKEMQPEDRDKAIDSLMQFRGYLQGFTPQRDVQQNTQQKTVAPSTKRRPLSSFGG